MKNKAWRYTEHLIDMEHSSGLGWLKLALTYVLVSPLRLVNEISQKILFLGKNTLKKVILHALGINLSFIIWALFWSLVGGGQIFIPYTVMFTSLALTVFIYYVAANSIKDFDYQIIQNIDVIEEEKQLNVDPDELVAFEKIKAAQVSFSDSINIFIKDPEELVALGVHPALYQDAEEARLLNAIEQKENLFVYDKIEIPDFLDISPISTKLDKSYNAIIAELNEQLA